ncbi:hypothetical protein TNCV_3785601 [Trichonephila clavipes]|nr:hypothetical protein TNCV_3785601 [Trichonephila clavipes]
MPNSPSQMIPDILNWRKVCGSIRSRKGNNKAKTVLGHLCRMRPSIVVLKNGSWEPLHEWQHMGLQDAMDIPLGCYGVLDQY